MILVDILLVTLAFILAYEMRNRIEALYPMEAYLWPLVFGVAIWIGGMYQSGMYASFRMKKAGEGLYLIYQTAYLGVFVYASLLFVLKITYVSRALVLMAFAFSMAILAVEKIALIIVLRRLRKRGFNYRNVLIVGTGPRAQKLVQALEEHREFGLKIVGILDPDKGKVGQVILNHTVIGTLKDLPWVTREKIVDQVFFVVPRSWLGDIEQAVLYLERLGVRIDIAVDYFNMSITHAQQSEFFGIPFLSFESTPGNLLPLFIKRLMDIVLSGIAIVVLSPVFAITAVLIKLTSEGPVFFVQKRVSMNGRLFNLFKFRTMVKDAEEKLEDLQHLNEMDGPVFKITKDPRVTPVGAVLRKTSIDELPQLWNVFLGHMSLVGPRPPLPSEVEKYDDWQRRSLSMRPGITCLWQISGRNRITDFDEWARLDLEYIDNWSLWLDLKILLRTIPVVFLGTGAK